MNIQPEKAEKLAAKWRASEDRITQAYGTRLLQELADSKIPDIEAERECNGLYEGVVVGSHCHEESERMRAWSEGVLAALPKR